MKKIKINWLLVAACLLLVCASALGAATSFNIEKKPTADWFRSGDAKDTGWGWAKAIDRLVSGGSVTGTGSIFYVDSGVTNAGDGSSWSNAVATLDEAIDLCTDDAGDVIYVAEGHAENISGAGTVTCDKSGVTIIGYGSGDLRPTFTWTAAAGTWIVSDNAVMVYNCRFTAGISAVVTGFSVSATGDAFTLTGCEFVNPGTSTYEFINMITLASGSDYVTIEGNKMVSTVSTTGCVNAILASAGVVNRLTIVNNDIQGNFITTGAIYSNQINTNCFIGYNAILQTATGVPAINFTAAATGFCVKNVLYSDTFGTAGVTILDPGSMVCAENYAINTTDKSAILVPPLPAISTQSVTAGSEADILAKLYYTADGTGAYPATIATDSALAKIMVKSITPDITAYDNATDSLEALSDQLLKIDGVTLATAPTAASLASFIASGGVALGTQLATSKSLVDALGSNGTTVADTATGLAGIVGVPTDADNVVDSSTIVSNPDGSVLERQEYQQKCQEIILAVSGRSVAGSAMPLAVWYVDGNIGSSGNGKSPAAAFKTIAEAITACSNTVDDWVLIYDFSGGGATLTIDKSFVHLIGNAVKGMPYPRIKPASAVAGITFTDSGDRVEIANLVIGGGDQTVAAIDFVDCTTGAYGNYIHDCVIGRDADAPANDGISIPAGADAPYLVVENCTFYGTAMSGCDQSGIDIAGNCTGGSILNNYFADIGSSTNPAINLSGTVGNMRIEGNRIAGTDDTAAGWGITLSANCTNIFVDDTHAASSDAAGDASAFLDSAADEANAWGINYTDITADLP